MSTVGKDLEMETTDKFSKSSIEEAKKAVSTNLFRTGRFIQKVLKLIIYFDLELLFRWKNIVGSFYAKKVLKLAYTLS